MKYDEKYLEVNGGGIGIKKIVAMKSLSIFGDIKCHENTEKILKDCKEDLEIIFNS